MRIRPWNVDWVVRNTYRKITGKRSLEEERQKRMALLREMLYPGESRFVKPAISREYFGKLAEDFTVSQLALAKRDGTLLVSASGKDVSSETKIFNSVSSEIPDAKYLLIKGENKTHVVYPDNGSLLVVEADGNVSPIEMKVLMGRIRKGEQA